MSDKENKKVNEIMKGIHSKANKPEEQPPQVEQEPPSFESILDAMMGELMERDPELGRGLIRKLENLAFSSSGMVSEDQYRKMQMRGMDSLEATCRHLIAMGNHELSFKLQVALAKVGEVFEKEVYPYMRAVGKLGD